MQAKYIQNVHVIHLRGMNHPKMIYVFCDLEVPLDMRLSWNAM